jgi:hypothetical protein
MISNPNFIKSNRQFYTGKDAYKNAPGYKKPVKTSKKSVKRKSVKKPNYEATRKKVFGLK